MKRWFEFRAEARGAEIAIYDEIGAFGIPAKTFLDELKDLPPAADLTLRLNSPGGSGLSAAGISSQAEGPNTAEDVEKPGCRAAEMSRGLTDGSAPTESMP